MAMIWKQRPSRPSGSCLVLHNQRRCSKVAARSRPCPLSCLIGKVLSIVSIPLQAKQWISSTTSMFFTGWEIQYYEKGSSYGQLVIGSFITTCTRSCITSREFFGKTSNHPVDPAPLQLRFGALWFLAFPKIKTPFKREEISDLRWDSGKYNRAADGNSNKEFCRVFWTVEEVLGELHEPPRCPLWRELMHHCPTYNVLVPCIFFSKCLYFSYYMAGYFLNIPLYLSEHRAQCPLTIKAVYLHI